MPPNLSIPISNYSTSNDVLVNSAIGKDRYRVTTRSFMRNFVSLLWISINIHAKGVPFIGKQRDVSIGQIATFTVYKLLFAYREKAFIYVRLVDGPLRTSMTSSRLFINTVSTSVSETIETARAHGIC